MKPATQNFLIISITIALLALIVVLKTPPGKIQEFTIYPPVKDMGSFSINSKDINLVLDVKNETDEDLNIVQVSTSCGCTNAIIPGSRTLKAKETRTLNVKFLVNDRLGDVRSSVRVTASNEKGNQLVAAATIYGHGITAATVQPTSLKLGVNYIGDERHQGRLIVKRGEETSSWDGLDCVCDDMRTSATKIGEDTFAIDISPKELGDVLGTNQSVLNIFLTRNGHRLEGKGLKVPVFWEIAHKNISINPSTVFLGVLNQNSVHSGSINIRPAGNVIQKLEGLKAYATSENVNITLTEDKNSLVSKYSLVTAAKQGSISFVVETQIDIDGVPYKVRTPVCGFVE